jgi:phage shock protein E
MKKNILLLLIGFQFFLISSCNSQTTSNQGGETNAGAETTVEIDYSKSFLVDVRTPEEFAQGSVKGAINIPLSEIESRLAEFKDKNQIVVFCQSGNRSSQAMQILQQNNIKNVVNGGGWQNVDAIVRASSK